MKAYNKEKVEADLMNLRYRNIPNTRRAGINYIFSNEELIEWAKCYNNPMYFIEKYCITYLENQKIGNIKLHEYQKNIINFYEKNRFPIFLHSRHMGILLIFSLIYLHYILFNTNKLVYIFAPKYDIRFNFLNQIKMIYVGLPFFLKNGLTKWDDNNLVFENGCKIICSNTKNIDSALKTLEFQNDVVDIFHIMDMSYFNDDLIKRSFLSILPYISENNCKLIINSTASKDAKFLANLVEHSELPDEAPDKNTFETLKTYWWQLKNRDEKWMLDMIKERGENFDSEFNLKFF